MPEPAASDEADKLSPAKAEMDGGQPAGGAKIHELPVAKAAPKPAERIQTISVSQARPAELPRPKSLRRLLLALGPVLLIIGGGALYLTGGRYVSTDNAYVRADKLNLTAEVAGGVARIAVSESEAVTRGQILFQLDDQPYRIALAGAEAQLGAVRNEIATLKATYAQNVAQIEQARVDVGFYETAFQRQVDLTKRGVATQSNFDQAKRDLDAARERVIVAQRSADTALAQLGGSVDSDIASNPRVRQAQSQVDRARRDLSLTTITAPMDGVVTNVSALQVGQYLAAAQPAMSLVSASDIWVDANPKETEVATVKPGHPAKVYIDAYPGREWKAVVASISPATGAEFSVLPAQNASGNWVKVVQRVPVRLRVEREANAPPLRSGMSAIVEIDTGEIRTIAGIIASIRRTLGL